MITAPHARSHGHNYLQPVCEPVAGTNKVPYGQPDDWGPHEASHRSTDPVPYIGPDRTHGVAQPGTNR